MTDTTDVTNERRVIMSPRETTRWFVRHVDFEPSYFLGSVPVHVVDADHWLARHADEMPDDVVVHRGDEATAWRSIDSYDRQHGAPPRMLVIME